MLIVHGIYAERKHYVYFSQKLTATRNGVALSYHRVRGLYFLVVVFVATIVLSKICECTRSAYTHLHGHIARPYILHSTSYNPLRWLFCLYATESNISILGIDTERFLIFDCSFSFFESHSHIRKFLCTVQYTFLTPYLVLSFIKGHNLQTHHKITCWYIYNMYIDIAQCEMHHFYYWIW